MLWETVTVVALAVPENNNLRLNVHFTNKFVNMSKKLETYRRNAEILRDIYKKLAEITRF